MSAAVHVSIGVVHVAIVAVVLGPGRRGGLLGAADDEGHARIDTLVRLL